MPHMVPFAAGAEPGQVHLHQHVSRIEHALNRILLPAANLSHSLGGDHSLANLALQTECLDAAFQLLLHLALETRITVDDVPLHVRIGVFFRNWLSTLRW